MPSRKLTPAFVASAKPVDGKLTEYADTVEKGLSLRVTPSGEKSWTFRYRTEARQQKRFSIGKVRDVSLADARTAVIKHRGNVAGGGDPVEDAKAAKAQAIEQYEKETVSDIGEWYFRECEAGRHKPNLKRPKRLSTINQERRYFDKYIVPAFGKQRLDDLKRATIQAFVNDLSTPGAARQCRIILHGIYAFAQRQELTEKNPCQHVTVPGYEARERTLSDQELGTIWKALSPPVKITGAYVSPGVACAILLAMVTLQRRAEVTGMSLQEIDRDKRLWLIPGRRTKNHRSHAVPLSDLALVLVDRALSVRTQECAFVFPSPHDPNRPIEPHAMTRAFGRMKKALGLDDVRPHDLRRTGATNLTSEQLGFPRFVVSRVLNHVSDTGGAAAVTAVYDHNEYLPEKRQALDAWAARLREIVAD